MKRIGTPLSPYIGYAKLGHMMKRYRPEFAALGLEKAREWFQSGKLFFDELEPNQRKAHCKVCGRELIKGEGKNLLIYDNSWYHLSFYFACDNCQRLVIKE